VAEAFRWGEPCVMCDEGQRAHWAVPVLTNQRLCGGLLVAAGELRRPRTEGALDRRLLRACRCLFDLAVDRNLTNAALLAERCQFASRERERAEALHSVRDHLHDDIRGTYLREEPALLAAIRRGERAEARRIINRVLAAIYSVGESRLQLLKSLALELVVMMARAAVQAGADKAGAETVIVNVTALDCPLPSFTVIVTGNEPETGRVPLKGKLEPVAVAGPTLPGMELTPSLSSSRKPRSR